MIASNGAGQPTMLRSTDGITFATVTIPATSGGVSNFMATPDHAVAPAPAERPHFIDRGLPIEIAGPRNDITRRAYLPIVRIFGS